MATLSQQMVGAALDSSDPSKYNDTTASFNAGLELAKTIGSMQERKAQLEQAKVEQEQKKYEKAAAWFDTAAKMPDGAAKKAFVNNYIPNGIKALGLADKIDPNVIGMLQGDPALGSFLRQQIAEGKVSMNILNSPEGLAELAASPDYKQFGGMEALKNTVSDYRLDLDKIQGERVKENESMKRTQVMADAQMGRQLQEQGASGEVELRKQTAKKLAAASSATVNKNVTAIDDVIKDMQTGKIKFGTLGKTIPYGANEDVLARVDPKAKAAIDKIRGAVNVRATLADPNPTEKQINTIMSRAIDPRLSNEENIAKLQAMKKEMLDADAELRADAKRFGLMNGKESKSPSSISIPDAKKKQFKSLSAGEQKKALDGLAKIYNTDLATVRKALGLE